MQFRSLNEPKQTEEASIPRRIPAPNRTMTVLGKGVAIRGQIFSGEDMLIDGVIQAPIVCKDHAVALGPNSKVAGNIEARNIELRGEIEGDVRAHESIHICSGSLVAGSVTAQAVQIERSARVRAQLFVGDMAEEAK
jgi:cytoskeletal protein CcmA (bactofilin family)